MAKKDLTGVYHMKSGSVIYSDLFRGLDLIYQMLNPVNVSSFIILLIEFVQGFFQTGLVDWFEEIVEGCCPDGLQGIFFMRSNKYNLRCNVMFPYVKKQVKTIPARHLNIKQDNFNRYAGQNINCFVNGGSLPGNNHTGYFRKN